MELNRRGFLSGLLGTAVIAAFPHDLVSGITAVPEVKAPEGVTYEWARTALLGEPDLENIERRIANGWTFVTQEAHPGIEVTGFAEVVERNGLALMQKPTVEVEKARAAARSAHNKEMELLGLQYADELRQEADLEDLH